MPIKSYLTHKPFRKNDSITESVGAANDDEHQEEKKKRTYKKGATLRLDGPVAGLCSLEKGAAYIGVDKSCIARGASAKSDAWTQDPFKP
ncbi:Uncharacterised protein [Escherichia coli]|nr:Uncharacterised protein [Escherichia coli]